MNNSTTYEDTDVITGLATLATFETLVAVIAILIIVTSSLVVKNIYDKTPRTRADSMFILLSISDIGVGVLSMPALGVYMPFENLLHRYYFHGSSLPLIITIFCYHFPYIFSSLLTAVIAIDRLLFITWQTSYKHIITETRLRRTVGLLFAMSVGGRCVHLYYVLPDRCCYISYRLECGWLGIIIISLTAVIFAYIRIIFFVQKSSKSMLVYKHSNSKSDRRLSTTICLILICQVTCVVPFIIVLFLQLLGILLSYNIIGPWVVILRNCQCFCNGLIWLKNHKTDARKSETFPVKES